MRGRAAVHHDAPVVHPPAGLLTELALNATTAGTVQLADGWLLRAAPDLPFRRSSSVAPLRSVALDDLDQRLAGVGAFAARHGIEARIQMAPPPSGEERSLDALDAALEARGWAVEAPVTVMVGDPAVVAERCGDRPHLQAAVRPAGTTAPPPWAGWDAGTGRSPSPEITRLTAYERLLAGIGPAGSWVSSGPDGDPVPTTVAAAVVERGWVGVFGMVTRPGARRLGGATAALSTIASWALAQGCTGLYLQVEVGNEAARTLYGGAGFVPVSGYHYRTAGPST